MISPQLLMSLPVTLSSGKRLSWKQEELQEDLNVGEDVDLCWRVRKLGYHLLYLPQGEVKHKHRNDLISM